MAGDSEQLELGREAFNRGEYFLAHELWEEMWREMTDAEQRVCVQGLIQIAAGLHHLQQRRARPAAGLLRKGLEKLSRPRTEGIGLSCDDRIDRLAGEVTRLLLELDGARIEMTDLAPAADFTRLSF
jgi:predicted metal-dependent hydrolase